ncbi:MAG: phosphatidate cytidylyltransferase [Pirellulales bacterium]|nr:phosphatidate cytidylyltransferase [Pirellulales bacterium]
MTALAQRLNLHPHVFWTLCLILLALAVGSALRLAGALWTPREDAKIKGQLASLRTWWVLTILMSAVVLGGRYCVVGLFVVVSLQALREFHGLVSTRIAAGLWPWAIVAVPIHYAIVASGALGPFWTFIPVWVLGVLLVRLVVGAQTRQFLETTGTVFLGLMLLVFLLSHAALVTTLPLVPETRAAGPLGLFVYLVLLTECNDIAQALWGRRWGRHPIMTTVSPHKTWEGFLLGAATTVCLSLLLGSYLTPLADAPLHVGQRQLQVPYLPAAISGVLIAIGGFFGDVTISAIKREVGVKDSGSLLPGQGGILDRIDSLTYTGPLFFYFVYIFCG